MMDYLKGFFTRQAHVASSGLIYVITPPAHQRLSVLKVVGSVLSIAYFVFASMR
ncbi:hypothetical protein [Methylosoma difficile]